MRSYRQLVRALAAAAIVVAPSVARAQTYGFEDISCDSGTDITGYNGFTWFRFSCYNNTMAPPPDNRANGASSGVNFIYNRGGTGAFIARAAAFDFTSAYVTRAGFSGETYRFTAFLGAGLVGFVDVNTSLTPSLVNFNFTNVDKIVMDNISNPLTNAGLFLDDITFVPTHASTVPEPASLALLATGFVALAGFSRRRRSR